MATERIASRQRNRDEVRTSESDVEGFSVPVDFSGLIVVVGIVLVVGIGEVELACSCVVDEFVEISILESVAVFVLLIRGSDSLCGVPGVASADEFLPDLDSTAAPRRTQTNEKYIHNRQTSILMVY